MFIYIHIYIYDHTCIYIYIYIYVFLSGNGMRPRRSPASHRTPRAAHWSSQVKGKSKALRLAAEEISNRLEVPVLVDSTCAACGVGVRRTLRQQAARWALMWSCSPLQYQAWLVCAGMNRFHLPVGDRIGIPDLVHPCVGALRVPAFSQPC